jgi:hypothetical protein
MVSVYTEIKMLGLLDRLGADQWVGSSLFGINKRQFNPERGVVGDITNHQLEKEDEYAMASVSESRT